METLQEPPIHLGATFSDKTISIDFCSFMDVHGTSLLV